jgi:hypothetical protein
MLIRRHGVSSAQEIVEKTTIRVLDFMPERFDVHDGDPINLGNRFMVE